ncbi:protein APEM9 [Citrus sinensis]|uniref:Protein APEM9 n=1 Tax=Citrus sinensis TaxID=2711 RepID=A0ACB8P4W7_CITSI|nr:protein APEM9 [Citrus sinensis]
MGDNGISTCASPSIWEEIDQSESYLVCSMYEEAASLGSSVLKRLRDSNNNYNEESYDMMESAGMVFVQSLKEFGRVADILNELKLLFTSVTDIPVQVLLTGVCLEISEGSYADVREFLEEFLSKWSCVDGKYYVITVAGKKADSTEGCDGQLVLGIDQYLEVVEMYAVTLLGTVLNDVDLAISWIENAALPEENRQDLLRRLHSLYSLKASAGSQGSSLLPDDFQQAHPSLKDPNVSERSSETLNTSYLPIRENVSNQTILKVSRQTYPGFWWFWPITLKLGNARIVLSNKKIVLGCLIFLAYYVIRRKRTDIRSEKQEIFLESFLKKTCYGLPLLRIVVIISYVARSAWRKILSVKKALVDLWQLAFAYQVNPLAAVQPLPAATRGGR